MEKLCIASTNKSKIRELKQILNSHFDLFLLDDFGPIPEAEEPFDSFLENAKAKAKYYAEFTKMPTLSEDAGLCIYSLNHFPGIHSKRFIMESGGLPNAFDRLERMLSAKEDRRATFICASVIYDPQSGQSFTGEGAMGGTIRFPAKGPYGFDCDFTLVSESYDFIFVSDGYDQTIAELGEAIKSTIGHRGKSVRALLKNYRPTP